MEADELRYRQDVTKYHNPAVIAVMAAWDSIITEEVDKTARIAILASVVSIMIDIYIENDCHTGFLVEVERYLGRISP